jgi:hypothetical protein
MVCSSPRSRFSLSSRTAFSLRCSWTANYRGLTTTTSVVRARTNSPGVRPTSATA